MTSTNNRLQNEKIFHDQLVEGAGAVRKRSCKYYRVQANARKRYKDIILQLCNGKKLLEYGCGPGSGSLEWLKKGAVVTGIDISSESIKNAKTALSESPYDAEYHVMNAEKTTFEDHQFDMIVGTSIIHHLALSSCYKELQRLLTKEGHAIFLEPLGHNPLINLYRYLTPTMRTEDEHPLTKNDLKWLSHHFNCIEIDYFALLALLAVPFRNYFFFDPSCRFLQRIDQILFKLPFIKHYAWIVVIHASEPK
jgi:2-polyprenyl-3-methyl-5-hydroxy-6-metoxy-1,4-benzoquinol methylase